MTKSGSGLKGVKVMLSEEQAPGSSTASLTWAGDSEGQGQLGVYSQPLQSYRADGETGALNCAVIWPLCSVLC